MGSSKRYHRNAKPQAQFRSRTTRSSKGRLLTDPAQNTQLLSEQLRALGLYAAPTLGDGNCLFRALSDQLYGSPSHHMQLRKDICDWIEHHKQRYEPFVEDERGLDVHLRCMRENATYGGHMELSAFAHLTQRNVKVIQPGLVYVIEWNVGGDLPAPDPPEHFDPHIVKMDETLNERDKRRLRRDKKKARKDKNKETEQGDLTDACDAPGAIYVAYHDWEHFSSIRKIKGPHVGLPYVTELDPDSDIPPPSSKAKLTKSKSSPSKRRSLIPSPESQLDSAGPSTPSQIPLPNSRSASRSASPSPAPSDTLPSHTATPLVSIAAPTAPSNGTPVVSGLPLHRNAIVTPRIQRSPKRSFDESSGSSASESVAKRTRSSRLSCTSASNTIIRASARGMHVDAEEEEEVMDIDVDGSTPGLSAPGSSVESSVSSDISSPPLASPPPPLRVKPMTRRQRKAAGLPKPRVAVVGGVSAGKIVIPGGKYKKGVGIRRARDVGVEEDDGDEEGPGVNGGDDGEWKRNGTGRLDVRGFRELKI